MKIEGKERFANAKWEEEPRIIGDSLGRSIAFLGYGQRNQVLIGLLEPGENIESTESISVGTLDELFKFGNAPVNLTEEIPKPSSEIP